MTTQLAYALGRKILWNMIPFIGENTKRIDEPQSSQKARFVMVPDVVFEDPDTKSVIAIGSGKNAAFMAPGDFDLVIKTHSRLDYFYLLTYFLNYSLHSIFFLFH